MQKVNFITTPLPIAYRKGNELTIKSGLILDKKNDVWGVQLPNGVIISIQCIERLPWYKAQNLANQLMLGGRSGSLPSQKLFTSSSIKEVMHNTMATFNVLNKEGFHIANDGAVWCCDELIDGIPFDDSSGFYFNLLDCTIRPFAKEGEGVYDRLAVVF